MAGIVSEMFRSPDWRRRRGGCIVIALVVEGCGVHMLNNSAKVVDALLPLLDDPDYRVRYMVRTGIARL